MTHTAEDVRKLITHPHNAGCKTTRDALRAYADLIERVTLMDSVVAERDALRQENERLEEEAEALRSGFDTRVRLLRENAAELTALRQTVERVSNLPFFWRKRTMTEGDCADELTAALPAILVRGRGDA